MISPIVASLDMAKYPFGNAKKNYHLKFFFLAIWILTVNFYILQLTTAKRKTFPKEDSKSFQHQKYQKDEKFLPFQILPYYLKWLLVTSLVFR